MTKDFFEKNTPVSCGNHRLSLWHCKGCRLVHLRAGQAILSFNTGEFAAFTEAVLDVYYDADWQMSQWALPSGDPSEANEILASEMIA